MMKNIALFVLSIFAFGSSPQIPAGTAMTASSTMGQGTLAQCATPTVGWSGMCITAAGVYITNNGGTYFLLTPQGAAGVTSVTACTAANPPVCGTPQSGPVVLTIPKVAPAVALQ